MARLIKADPATSQTGRWIMGGMYGPRQYNWAQCAYCGRAGEECKRAVCLLCETPQCFKNGAGDGTCSICGYGWLPGWSRASGRTCGYKGCEDEAIADVPRVKRACAGHIDRVKVQVYGHSTPLREVIAQAIAERDAGRSPMMWRFVA